MAGDIRYRCRRCGYTFGPLTGSWMATSKVELTTRLWLVKLFELEVTARQAAVADRRELPDGASVLHHDQKIDPGRGGAGTF